VLLLRCLVERVKELVTLGYGYLQALLGFLARLAFSDEPLSTPVRHNASILPLLSLSLESPRLKLGRADEHLDVLDEELRVFFKSYAYPKLLEHTLDGPWHVVLANPPAKPLPPPPRLSLICGDAIQNLRAALDHLVWQLVLLEGNRPGGWTKFPITTHVNDFNSSVRVPKDPKKHPSPLQGITVDSDAWTLIEEAQPYKGGQMGKDPAIHELSFLAFLSNTDKHRTLMSQLVFPGRATLRDIIDFNPDASIVEYRVPNQPLSLIEKTEVIRVRFLEPGPDPQVRVKRKLPVQPTFGDRTKQVQLFTIKHIRGHVRRFIDRFERFF
jgi:hypothetical protein